MNIPRIRGRTGQGDDNKWYFEISMWNFEGIIQIGGKPIGTFGPFETEQLAKNELRKAAELVCKSIKGPNGETCNGFVDLKNGGVYRNFNEN